MMSKGRHWLSVTEITNSWFLRKEEEEAKESEAQSTKKYKFSSTQLALVAPPFPCYLR